MDRGRGLSVCAIALLLAACTEPRGLLRTEHMDVAAVCRALQVDAIDQYGGGRGTPPTDLVFSFANRSTTDTLHLHVDRMTLTDLGTVMPLSTSCRSLALRPLEVRQCRVFWNMASRRHLSDGALFRLPVQCGGAVDTVRCVLR